MTDYILNICALGDGQVGKTSITRRFVAGEFSSDYKKTIGDVVSKKEVYLGDDRVTMLIHDPSGQKLFASIQDKAIRGSKGAIILFDMTRKNTFDNLKKYWLPKLQNLSENMPFVLVGNKNDAYEKEVDISKIENLSKDLDMPYYLSSAKTGENVEKTFADIGKLMLDKKKPKYPRLW